MRYSSYVLGGAGFALSVALAAAAYADMNDLDPAATRRYMVLQHKQNGKDISSKLKGKTFSYQAAARLELADAGAGGVPGGSCDIFSLGTALYDKAGRLCAGGPLETAYDPSDVGAGTACDLIHENEDATFEGPYTANNDASVTLKLCGNGPTLGGAFPLNTLIFPADDFKSFAMTGHDDPVTANDPAPKGHVKSFFVYSGGGGRINTKPQPDTGTIKGVGLDPNATQPNISGLVAGGNCRPAPAGCP